VEIDHVVLAVTDLEHSGRVLEERHGLRSTMGGSHARWGTANRIVPLGTSYVELITVEDEEAARREAFGRMILDSSTDAGSLVGWAVRTDDLDGIAARLRLTVDPGSRARPDGSEVRWRLAGLDEAVREPCLPFFIEWAPGSEHPGRALAEQSGEIESVTLSGDDLRVSAWLGSHELPLELVPGEPGVRGARVVTADGRSAELG